MAAILERLRAHLVGRYRIERELGRGGMAKVYLAEDLKHHRRVAIKVLLPEVAAALGPERFLREIEIAARLTHPHIVPMHDSGTADGLPYYVMPYVEGESLRERISRQKQLPVEEALRIAREVAGALDYAHRLGVIHRDIKPENILLAGGEAVVADFGIARAVGAAAGEKLTTTGVMIGTPGYVSPEQAAGRSGLDARSDVYSLGCVLYEMLGGQPPFVGPTAEVVIAQHLGAPPPDVRVLRPSVPAEVSAAVTRALAKLPADRFGSAAEFVKAFGPAAGGTAGQAPSAGAHRRRLVAAFAVVIVGAGLAVWVYREDLGGWMQRRPPPVAKKDWIIVAEFQSPPGEPDLGEAARSLVGVALDQSSVVATVSRAQIQVGLERAGKPDSARLTPALARELAYRGSIRAVLEGEIRGIGKGYSLTVNLVDAEDGRTILSLSEVARDRGALIPSVERIGHRLRSELGERRNAIAASRPLVRAVTPSFEAFQQFVRARQLSDRGDLQGAIPHLRRAVELDSAFAAAWYDLANCIHNLGFRDSSFVILQKVRAHADRLDEMGRQALEWSVALWAGDLAGARASADRMIALDPSDWEAWDARGFVEGLVGRFGEAARCYERVSELSPFGWSQTATYNLFVMWIAAGEVERAQALVTMMSGEEQRWRRMEVSLAAEEWPTAESLATVFATDPTIDLGSRRNGALALQACVAARGEATRADSIARALETGLTGEPFGLGHLRAARNRLLLLQANGRSVPSLSGRLASDTTVAGLVLRGTYAVAVGEVSDARRFSRLVRERPVAQLLDVGDSPNLLDARIAAAEGRWQEVLRLMAPVARTGLEVGRIEPTFPAGRVASRLMVADAFEHLGQPDSAAVYLELVLAPPVPNVMFQRPVVTPFVHRRLVLLYARMGRVHDARRHMDYLDRKVDRPDADLRARIREARAALAGAEGMAKSPTQ